MIEHYQRSLNISRVNIIHPVLFYDDCDGSLLWTASGDGADYAVAYDATQPHVGTNSLKLSTRATTPANGDFAQADKRLWLPPTRYARLQLCYRPYSIGHAHTFRVILLWYNGTVLATAELRFTTTAESVSYYNSAAGLTAIDSWKFCAASTMWNHIDMSVDFEKLTYSRIAVNQQVTDLSAQSLFTAADATTPHLRIYLHLVTLSANQVHIFLDQILLTPETL